MMCRVKKREKLKIKRKSPNTTLRDKEPPKIPLSSFFSTSGHNACLPLRVAYDREMCLPVLA